MKYDATKPLENNFIKFEGVLREAESKVEESDLVFHLLLTLP